MREFLFRGKRLDNGQWVYGGICQTEQWTCIMAVNDFEGSRYEPPSCEIEDFEVNPETVGQYTGVLDKNGDKIFEGDIIKGKRPKDLFIVEYNQGTATFTAEGLDGHPYPVICQGSMQYHEVIGNIYGNPALLNDEDMLILNAIMQNTLMPATPENFELMHC